MRSTPNQSRDRQGAVAQYVNELSEVNYSMHRAHQTDWRCSLGSDLSIRLSRREEVPTPSSAKRGQRLVPVPLWLAPKLALYLAMRDQQVNNSDLARRLGLHERVIRRILDPQHATKAEKIQAALAALGKQMTVEVRDAA